MQLNPAKILIVDDEPLLLEIFQSWLEREGYQTITAENGARGLALVTESHFDLIISDIRMPVMSGIEMARQLSRRPQYVAKIIFISGFSDLGERECFEIGIECLLTKPSRRSEFVAAARRSLTPRAELWQIAPPHPAETSLDASFAGLSDARCQGQIALGRGGFCVHSDLAAKVAQDIRFHLDFAADQQVLAGQGTVRWAAHETGEIGIEITHVEDHCRDWIVGLSQRDEIREFIPKQCGRAVAA